MQQAYSLLQYFLLLIFIGINNLQHILQQCALSCRNHLLLLQMLHGQADRRAHFHTTITCAFPNGDVLQDDGEVEGTIAFAPMGENGFGYDPVFFVPDKRKTFAQLTAEEKAEISHRGKALRAFKETLRNYLAEHQ